MKKFRSQNLKGILTGQWPDFGAPPEKSAMAFHCAVASDFLNGSYYPIGGAQRISDAVEAIVENHGGKCLVNRDVQEIIVENGRAVGVRTTHKGASVVYRAPLIVSNANVGVTFGKMVPEGYCEEEKKKIARLKTGVSALILFLGLKDDPRNHGFDDANYWLYSSSDHDLASNQSDPRMIEGDFFRLVRCVIPKLNLMWRKSSDLVITAIGRNMLRNVGCAGGRLRISQRGDCELDDRSGGAIHAGC